MTLLLLSLGVAMDAAAVSGGMAIRGARRADLLKLAVTFGVFQFAMSLAGSLGGAALTRRFSAVDHWVVFALLGFVGGKMLWEARASSREERKPLAPLTLATLLTLGIATSIDALAVGVTLPALELSPWLSTGVIGGVTLLVSLAGAWAGKRLGARFGTSVEVMGGLVLIAIGVKTLIEHLAG